MKSQLYAISRKIFTCIFFMCFLLIDSTAQKRIPGKIPDSPREQGTALNRSCNPASIPVLSASRTVICDGNTVTLSIQSGELNESDNWSWYSNSCGGTFLGSGTSISFTPVASAVYYARGEGGCATDGDCAAITVSIVSTMTAAVNISSDMGNAICNGTTVTFTAIPTNGGDAPSYQWKKNGLDVGTNESTYTDVSINNGDAISCELTSSESCVTNIPAVSNTIQMLVNFPTSSTTNMTVCGHELPVNWNGTNYATPGTYQASFTSAAGCDSTAFLHLSVNPGPTAGIINHSGTSTLSCAVSMISVTATGGVNYMWSNGLGNGANAQITTAGTYTVTVTDAQGCSAQASISISLNQNGLPAPAGVEGPVNVCAYVGTGQWLVYRAAPVTGATSYLWTVPSTVNIVSGQGTSVLTVTLSAGFTALANKQLRVRAVAPCATSAYAIKYLAAQLPGSIPAISGPTDVCPYLNNGSIVTYSIPDIIAATSYEWSVPPGVEVMQYSGTSIDVIFYDNFTTGSITVFATNDCGISNTRIITVRRVTPSRPSLITGISNACLLMPSVVNPTGTVATYSVTRIGGNIYNWAVPEGVTVVSQDTTPSTDYIEVIFSAAYTGGDISVTANNGCGTSPERVFKLVSYAPGSPSSITGGQIQSCPDRLYQYRLTSMPSNATATQWAVPVGGSIVSGQGTASIIVSYPDYTAGMVTVSGINGCGISGTRSLNVFVPQCNPEFTGSLPGTNTESSKKAGMPATDLMTVNVFSNPTTTAFKLQVSAAGSEKIKIKLTDMQGRILKTQEIIPNQPLQLGSELKAGIYILECRQGDQVNVTRLIKF